ncbi:hypothetical protein GP486_007849 [Trichoglossum hirsutum]|uniref:Uncharacterized protein n=1 Tax=Trichoglossum hirsutum TaxID=265104 RepID=A0A9P8IF27_9PEZI|nr:hypothetical protein GP486_007849 [Trichoglossum hirsutum]
MDMLIVISTAAAYVFSVVSFVLQVRGHPLSTGEFFKASTLLVTLIMVGELVSESARQWAVESVSIESLQATSATLVLPDGKGEREIDTRLLQYGDTFKVLPDSCVATDGVRGECSPNDKQEYVKAVCRGGTETVLSVATGRMMPLRSHKPPSAYMSTKAQASRSGLKGSRWTVSNRGSIQEGEPIEKAEPIASGPGAATFATGATFDISPTTPKADSPLLN